MHIRRLLVACALAAISTVIVPRLQPLHAEDDCGISLEEDYCETESDGMEGFDDFGWDDSGRRCGDYDGADCGGTTVYRTYRCTEWTVTSANGTVSIIGSKPLSFGAGATLQCSAWSETTRTITNRWERSLFN